MTTNESASHNYRMGFAYGSNIVGANNSTSYLWQYANEKAALPFTQVFIRPKLTSVAYPAIADHGVDESTVQPLLQSMTASTPWGVTGIVGGATGELDMEVHGFAQIGQTMYVGGRLSTSRGGPLRHRGRKCSSRTSPVSTSTQANGSAAFGRFSTAWYGIFKLRRTVSLLSAASSPASMGPRVPPVWLVWIRRRVQFFRMVRLGPVRQFDAARTGSRTRLPRQFRVYVGGRFNRVTGGNPSTGPITLSRATRLGQ